MSPDATEDRLCAIQKCILWVRQSGGNISRFQDGSLEFRESPERGGIGLFAKRCIRKGEPILYVPRKCCVYAEHPVLKGPFLGGIAKEVS
jgi:hypothetical protein